MKKIILCIILFSFMIAGCGDSNWFKFAHKTGSSGDIDSLTADADNALLNKDFSSALNYYEQILNKDPNNSEALYGASAAWMGAAGFDVASIISNIMTNKDKLSSPVLPQLLVRGGGVSKHATSDSILPSNMDWVALRTATGKAIEYLRRIAAGGTDNVIPANNTNVRVNLIVCLVLHYAIKAIDLDGDGVIENDPHDPITIDNDYNVSVDDSKIESDAERNNAVTIMTEFHDTVIDEIVANFDLLMTAYKIDTGDTIGELKHDILIGDPPDNPSFKDQVQDVIDELNALTF